MGKEEDDKKAAAAKALDDKKAAAAKALDDKKAAAAKAEEKKNPPAPGLTPTTASSGAIPPETPPPPPAPPEPPPETEPTAEELAAAQELMAKKMAPVIDAIRKTGAIDSQGNDVRTAEVLTFGPAPGQGKKQAAAPEKSSDLPAGSTKCPICKKTFLTTTKLRMHYSHIHVAKQTKETITVEAEPAPRADKQPDPPSTPVEPGKKPAAAPVPGEFVEFDAVFLFGMMAEIFPPPLTESEMMLLQRTKMRIRIPMWLYNVGVFLFIMGPRVSAAIPRMKKKWDDEVRQEEEKLRADEAAKKAQQRAEQAHAAAAAPVQAARPVAQPEPPMALVRAGDMSIA